MRLSGFSKKSIVLLIGILLVIFILGCGKGVVNSHANNQFDGTWEMEYSRTMLSFIEPGFDEYPISIPLRSVVTFEADSFNLQIIAPNSYQYLNKEYAGSYSISADTIIFNATYSLSFNKFDTNDSVLNYDLDLVERLRFKFKNQDSFECGVLSWIGSGNLNIIPMGSFLWNTSGIGLSRRTSGIYSRIDIE